MEHYRSLPDDELLSIYVSADLTDEARGLLSRELTARGLTENDVEDARRIDDYLMAERKQATAGIERQLRRMAIGFVALLLFALLGYLGSD